MNNRIVISGGGFGKSLVKLDFDRKSAHLASHRQYNGRVHHLFRLSAEGDYFIKLSSSVVQVFRIQDFNYPCCVVVTNSVELPDFELYTLSDELSVSKYGVVVWDAQGTILMRLPTPVTVERLKPHIVSDKSGNITRYNVELNITEYLIPLSQFSMYYESSIFYEDSGDDSGDFSFPAWGFIGVRLEVVNPTTLQFFVESEHSTGYSFEPNYARPEVFPSFKRYYLSRTIPPFSNQLYLLRIIG